MSSSIKIAWGRHKSGKFLHINDAENGKGCDCVCLECGSPLVAVQGKSGKRRWHFSHKALDNCNGMSALHRIAQECFLSNINNTIYVPKFSMTEEYTAEGRSFEFNSEHNSFQFNFTKVTLEKPFENKIVDVSCEDDDGIEIIFEIHVTNAKKEEDIESFNNQQLLVVEIDLSDMPWDATLEDIEKATLKYKGNKKIIAHPDVMRAQKEKLDTIRKESIKRKNEIVEYSSNEREMSYVYNYTFIDSAYVEHERSVERMILLGPALSDIKVTEDNNYHYKAYVNDKIEILVYCALSSYYRQLLKHHINKKTGEGAILANQPILMLLGRDLSKVEWLNTKNWDKKLHHLLEYDFTIKQPPTPAFVRFGVADLIKRTVSGDYSEIIKALNLPDMQYDNTFSYAWNCGSFVWKTIVLHYMLFDFKGSVISTSDLICEQKIFQILDCRVDNSEEREKEVRRWLEIIEQRGFILNARDQYYDDRDVDWFLNKPKYPIARNKTAYMYGFI